MILKDRKQLARLMVLEGVSHRELARAAGYRAHSYIGRLVRGEVVGVDTDPALRIAHRLQVAVDDLFLPEPSRNDGRSVQEGLAS